ncbi:glycoside hydrolase family 5 protein [Pleurotus ostreatus PC15]|uniref:Glycoside hydrolase family 5 protein n=1 Tax=Pleurotus ostreatus (strain PC15) TaxID=1137138 RepID=A0A067NL77_PLEO1|nr:glycoside hydrolase family 5 protein [Pleurotus ostreatus PC15]
MLSLRSISLVLLLSLDHLRVAASQCRLKVNNVLDDPSIPSPAPLPGNGTTTAPPDADSGNGTSTQEWVPFNYGKDTIRGVNLGGWLVLEPWITPSFFERTNNTNVVDEFTLGQLFDRDVALDMLKDHWETWITEDDFIAIKAAGLNHVRIPLGYWSVPLTESDTRYTTSVAPYIPGAWPYLLRALNWGRKHNVHVIVDLHGAPGSQNGYDNSGQRTGNPQWAVSSNVNRTVEVLRFIAKNAGGMIDVMELLNEPGGFMPSVAAVIRDFWLNGYSAVRDAAGEDIGVMIGDAFMGVGNWQNFLTPPQGHGVLMDFHEYQIFSKPELARTWDEHVEFACTHVNTLSTFASSNLWTIIGEWSNAPTDCAKWLNGRGNGARWDGSFNPDPSDLRTFGTCSNMTGSWEGWSDKYKTFLRRCAQISWSLVMSLRTHGLIIWIGHRYFEVQVEIGESIQGWMFWTWKAEQADEWSYQKGLEGGWIPKDPTDRMYPNLCS